jgi:hypothetical protein
MLTWDEEVKPSLPKDMQQGLQHHNASTLGSPAGRSVDASTSSIAQPARTFNALDDGAAPLRSVAAAAAPAAAQRVKAADKRIINARPTSTSWCLQVQVGLGKVFGLVLQPLDAAGSEHDARHRVVERPERPDRRRAPHRQAQPRLLRHGRLAGRQQHRAGHLPPHHGARVPPVPAAPGLRGSHPHARLPVHRGVAGPGRERDLQRLQRSAVDPRQGPVPDPVHRRHHATRTSTPARTRTTRRCSSRSSFSPA